jgi:hypothetical protein
MQNVIDHLRETLLRTNGADFSDGQLLTSFIGHQDQAAFAAIAVVDRLQVGWTFFYRLPAFGTQFEPLQRATWRPT